VNNPVQGDDTDVQILADAYNRIGDCYMSRRAYAEANTYYQKALDVSSVNGDYSLYQQAYIAGLQGNYSKKVSLLDKMSETYDSSVYSADALYEKGRSYVQTGDKKAASQAFTKIINEYPQSANARKACNELAMIQYESGETDAAANSYLRVIHDYPNTAEAQTALANLKDVYASQGKIDEYKSLAAKAGKPLTQDELETMLHDAAVKAVTKDDYVAAQSYYAQLKEQTTSESLRLEAQIGEARSAWEAKDYATVISTAGPILADGSKVSPEIQAEIRMNRAESYFAQKGVNKACADLEVLMKNQQTVYGAQATVRRAQYDYDKQKYDDAEKILLNFIDSGTPHTYWLARAFVLLSDVCSKQGRDVEAQQYLLSLKSNYTENEEINKMIEERLK
jgi:TolA-binding protein